MARCPMEHPTCHRETEKECPTKGEDGSAICTLGKSDFPVYAGNAFVAYEIKPTASGMLHVKLSLVHRSYLKLLSERGGETEFDYSKVEPEAEAHLKRLVEMKLIEEIPLIGRDRAVRHRLTDIGRNVTTQILKGGV